MTLSILIDQTIERARDAKEQIEMFAKRGKEEGAVFNRGAFQAHLATLKQLLNVATDKQKAEIYNLELEGK